MPDMHLMDYYFHKMVTAVGPEWRIARRRAYQHGFNSGWTNLKEPV